MEKKRNLALDFLRGITIFGMVFSAIVPHGVLPAWMYHAQNPPPTHELDVTVQGITWVDMVFPIFIFCMGMAIPLAGNKRFEKWQAEGLTLKECRKKYMGESFLRFLSLWAFSYLYVLSNFNQSSSPWASLLTIAGFASFFPLYLVFSPKVPKRRRMVIRGLGALCVAAVILTGHFCFGEVISHHRRGIIIFLLAFLYLFASLIWLLDKRQRVYVFAAILIFTVITQKLGWPTTTYANPKIRWWFNLEYIYFLLLLLPAMRVGEGLKTKERFILVGVLVGLGLAFYPFTGGLTKVPCTIAYCLITCAIALLMYMLLEWLLPKCPKGPLTWIFVGAGCSPLMAYITFDNLVVPLMNLTGFNRIWVWAHPAAHPWIGVLSSAIMVLVTMAIVSAFSNNRLRWKA